MLVTRGRYHTEFCVVKAAFSDSGMNFQTLGLYFVRCLARGRNAAKEKGGSTRIAKGGVEDF